MRKVWLVGLGIGLVGVGWWAGAHHSTAPANSPPRSAVVSLDQRSADDDRLNPGGDDERLAALRAQLRKRDQLLGAMALASARASQTGGDGKPTETRTARAIRKLDQRLFEGAASEPGARDLRAAMEGVVRGLPSGVRGTIHCSAELCRVTVEGAEDRLDRDSGEMLERVPKEFAGTIVLPSGEGRRLVYAALRPDLLATSDRAADQ